MPCFHNFFIAPDIASPGIVIWSPIFNPDIEINAILSKYFDPRTSIFPISYVFGLE